MLVPARIAQGRGTLTLGGGRELCRPVQGAEVRGLQGAIPKATHTAGARQLEWVLLGHEAAGESPPS